MSKNEALRLHDLLLNLQRKRRLIAQTRGIGSDEAAVSLTYVDEQVLRALDFKPTSSIKEVAQLSHLRASWVSRIVSSLEERKLVVEASGAIDGRSKLLKMTKEGVAALTKLEEVVGAIIAATLSELTAAQVKRLAVALRAFCDGLGASPNNVSPQAHPVHVELSRLSRVMGVFSGNLLDTGMHNSQLYVFDGIEKNGDLVAIGQLDNIIPLDPSTISRTISAMTDAGLIRKVKSEADKRSYKLSLTPRGRDTLESYYAVVTKCFNQAFKSMSAEDRQNLYELLGKAVAVLPTKEAIKGGRIEIRSASAGSSEERIDGFLKKLAISRKSFAAASSRQLLYVEGKLAGLALVTDAPSDQTMKHIQICGESLDREQYEQLWSSCLDQGQF